MPLKSKNLKIYKCGKSGNSMGLSDVQILDIMKQVSAKNFQKTDSKMSMKKTLSGTFK